MLGLVCVHSSVGFCLLYPGLHLHTLLPSVCTLQASFASRHADSNEYNEQRVSEIKFDLKLDTSNLKTEMCT
jgi:hypothetical protein